MSPFAGRIDAFLDELFHLDPIRATEAGDHRFDDRWPDMTERGRAERLAFCDRWTAELRATDDADLSADDRIDRELLLLEVDELQFAEVRLRQECWDPLAWVYLLGGGLLPLLARDFAPLADRLGSVAGRLEGIPGLVAAARAALVGVDGRPVSRLHTDTALGQLGGIAELIDDALRAADETAADPAVGVVTPRLRNAAEVARAALTSFERHLREIVLPSSEGEGRLGRDLFAEKLHHTLKIGERTSEQILERAEREYVTVRSEMVRLARDLWPAWCPDVRMPPDDDAIVRGVLDRIAADHPRHDERIALCRAEIERIEAFCRERDLIGLTDEPLAIIPTPTFLRAFGGAMLWSPGPLDHGQKAFFSITPVPEDWTAEQVESYMREENARQLRILTIHEAVPGHYLQGVYANRCPSIARAILWSGVFVEGWAVYVTQVMMDAGFADDDPALLLNHWKFYLRAVTNAIIDAKIHAEAMTEDEAVELMVRGGFQEEAEARNKYVRARLTSTQLSTYFVGSIEFWEIEEARRRRLAAASGARGAAAVPPSRVVGGFGETPGFRYREHLEMVLSHGAPPTSLLRRIVSGDGS